jgi:probable rRNA maturation factor
MAAGTSSTRQPPRRNSAPSPWQIDVADRQRAVSLSAATIRNIAATTLSAEGVAAAQISVALVSNAEIHDINRRFLGHDYPTDVVSFLLDCEIARGAADRSSAKSSRQPRGTGKRIEGEIIISAEYATDEAARYGWSPASEMTLYLVHGLLHLCGYDDLSAAEKRRMRRREKQILARLGIAAKYTHKQRSKRRVSKKPPTRR